MKITKEVQAQARRLLCLCLVEGGRLQEERVRQVASELVQKKPRNYAELLAAFTDLVRLEVAKRTATVASAVPLTEREQVAIRAKLDARTPDLHYDWQVRPELLGGITVRVGDQVTDASLLSRINRLVRLSL